VSCFTCWPYGRHVTALRGLRRQFLGLLSARAAASLLQAAAVVLVGRSSGVAEFGRLGVVLSVGAVFMTVADLGASTLLVKARADGDDALVRSLLSLNAVTTAAASGLGVVVWGAFGALSGSLAPYWAVLAFLALAVEKNVDTALGVSVAEGASRPTLISVLLRRSVQLVVMVVLQPVVGALSGFALGYLLSVATAQLHLRRELSSLGVKVGAAGLAELRAAAKACAPYLVSNVSAQSRMLDVSIVAATAGAGSAGLYSASQRLANPILLIPQALTSVLMPHATRGTARRAKEITHQLALGTLVLCIAMASAVFWAEPLIVLLFGSAYAGAGSVLAIMLVSLPLVGLSSALGSVLQARGKQMYVAANGLVFAALGLAGLWVGASQLGAAGAAAAACATFLLKCVALMAAASGLDNKSQSRRGIK